MRGTVDHSSCISCGSCRDTCPGFFEQIADDTFHEIFEKFRPDGKITTGHPLLIVRHTLGRQQISAPCGSSVSDFKTDLPYHGTVYRYKPGHHDRERAP